MRQFASAALFLSLCGIAAAQTPNPPANPNPSMPAVANKNANNPGALAAGANSFTESQAMSRIQDAGFTNVSKLVKDKDGIWRGTASKAGAAQSVGLDYQGNIVAK